MYNKPLSRGHPLYNEQFLLVPMASGEVPLYMKLYFNIITITKIIG